MSALLKASRNDAIIARCLQTISQLIPLTSAVFYRVNNRLKPENYILHNISGRDADLVVMVDCQIPSDDLIVHFF